MHYYNFHIGDYKSHTHHLSPIEDLAYRRLLDLYYLTEKPIIADQAARLIGLREHGHDVLCVLMEFFTETTEGYINKRADEEIAEFHESQSQKSEQKEHERERQKRHREDRKELFKALRDKGLVPDYNTSTQELRSMYNNVTRDIQVCTAPVTRDATTIPLTNNHKPISKPTREPDGFAEFWLAYPKKVGKGAAEKSWAKMKPPIAAVLAAIKIQASSDQWKKDGGQFIPNPATWLNQKRWEDTSEPASLFNSMEMIDTPSGRMPRGTWEFIKGVSS